MKVVTVMILLPTVRMILPYVLHWDLVVVSLDLVRHVPLHVRIHTVVMDKRNLQTGQAILRRVMMGMILSETDVLRAVQ